MVTLESILLFATDWSLKSTKIVSLLLSLSDDINVCSLDSELISIERETGAINVLPINRDLMKIEFYPFLVRKPWTSTSDVILLNFLADLCIQMRYPWQFHFRIRGTHSRRHQWQSTGNLFPRRKSGKRDQGSYIRNFVQTVRSILHRRHWFGAACYLWSGFDARRRGIGWTFTCLQHRPKHRLPEADFHNLRRGHQPDRLRRPQLETAIRYYCEFDSDDKAF